MKPIVFLPEAEQELLEAAYYYQLQSSGLSIDYLCNRLNELFNLLQRHQIPGQLLKAN